MTERATPQKSAEAYRTISEVAEDLSLPQHVLRFWETRFPQVRPLKRAGGRRFYRPDDVLLLRAVKTLLYGDGYTIRGVQRLLREQGPRAVAALAASPAATPTRSDEPAFDALEAGEDATADDATASAVAEASPDEAADEAAWAVDRSDPDDATAQDVEARLRAVLVDLADCVRILDAVRGRRP